MKERENGWNLKASGYMTAEPSYQKIWPKKACDAIELGRAITFVRVKDGSDTESRVYVPKEHINNLEELVMQYHSAMRCMLETGTWPTDPAWLEKRMRELGIEVD